MANLTGTFPFAPGSRLKLKTAVGIYPAGTQVYVVWYKADKDTTDLNTVIVRVPDDGPEATFDLEVSVAKLEKIV